MSIFEIFKKKPKEVIIPNINYKKEEIKIPDSNELLELSNNNIIDTTNEETIAKFKHNLKVLYNNLNQTNKIDKFVTIREDNFYPYNSEWIVNSKDTSYEEVNYALTLVLKERINKTNTSIYMPARFRSTKHFTINTPLGTTGSYNGVEDNRDFVVIDTLDNLINSDYTYSIAPQDAYIDVTHEPLKISNDAIIMIKKERYEQLKDNQELMNELNNKNVILYNGDEIVAIDMVLTQIGVLPSKVATRFYEDNTGLAYKQTEESLKTIANNKNIMYNKSHGGENGHFSSKIDDLNKDYEESLNNFIKFLKTRLNIDESIINNSIKNKEEANKLIDIVGEEKIYNTILEYNKNVKESVSKTRKEYIEQRSTITEEISDIFKKTVKRIKSFYNNKEQNNYSSIEISEIEENIRLFFQQSSIEEQLKQSSILLKKINKPELQEMFNNKEEINEERGYRI